MTSHAHDCVTTRESLIDLLYDELSAEDATALRKEAEACPGCADHLARLEDGLALAAALPMAEPSANFDQRLMALAHQGLGGAPDAAAEAPRAEGLGWLARFRQWMTGPQAAMATLTLLVAALGIWYLPRQHEPVGAAGDTVVNLELDGEAVASAPAASTPAAAPEPAEEPAPDAPRQRARASRGGEREATVEGFAQAAAPTSEAPTDAPALDELTLGVVGTGAAPDEASGEEQAAAEVLPQADQRAEADLADVAGRRQQIAGPTAGLAPTRSARAPGAPPAPARRAAGRAGGGVDDLLGPTHEEGAAEQAQASSMTSQGAGDRQAYERGVARYRARDYRGAIDELDRVVTAPSPDARTLVPGALHRIAQSLRATGACREAVVRYESLLRRFPGYAQAPQAMMEASDCYRRVGRLSDARRWASAAQGYAATAAAARRELLRLDSMESGSRRSRRSRPAAAAPASADTAASVESAY